MPVYKVTYTCPHCPDECSYGKDRAANELIRAESKTEARQIFQHSKSCRWKKISRIEIMD